MAIYSKPLPTPGTLDQHFYDHAREGRLAVQTCAACGDRHFPATPVCPNCLSAEQRFAAVSGRGRLEAWAEFHRAYFDGFKDEVPYNICVVRLAEGPLLVSTLVDGYAAASLGAPVHAVFDAVTDEVTLPRFKLD